ncbi:MAG: hypothetical protein LC768_06275 [Acidobacteria bacterium]|nr:hypothetical protein [Acidobacteriota bacterium]
MSQTRQITRMLREWSGGNREALEDLMPLVYDELHKQAARFLSRERYDRDGEVDFGRSRTGY